MAQEPHKPGDALLEAWVLANLGRAVAYARSLVRNYDAAEDIVQDCFFRLLRRADEYDLIRDGQKLLYRAVTNACINYTQRRKTWMSLERDGQDNQLTPCDPRVEQPWSAAQGRELDAAIQAALGALPLEQRAAVELKSLGHSQADIAAALGRTSNHVGVLIHRARRTLKQALAEYLGDDEA